MFNQHSNKKIPSAEKLLDAEAVKVTWEDDESEEEEEKVPNKKQKMIGFFAQVAEDKEKEKLNKLKKQHKFFTDNCLKNATSI